MTLQELNMSDWLKSCLTQNAEPCVTSTGKSFYADKNGHAKLLSPLDTEAIKVLIDLKLLNRDYASDYSATKELINLVSSL